MDREFRADLVEKMDKLVQDFRERKTSKIKTLFQILQIIWQAEISESVGRTALEQYTTHIELIDQQHQLAGRQGDHAAGAATGGDGQTGGVDGDGPQQNHTSVSRQENAGQFLRVLQKELVTKWKQRVSSDSSDSGNGSDKE
jgi:hypothetical protein